MDNDLLELNQKLIQPSDESDKRMTDLDLMVQEDVLDGLYATEEMGEESEEWLPQSSVSKQGIKKILMIMLTTPSHSAFKRILDQSTEYNSDLNLTIFFCFNLYLRLFPIVNKIGNDPTGPFRCEGYMLCILTG